MLSQTNKILSFRNTSMSPDAISADAHMMVTSAVARRRRDGAKRAVAVVARLFGFSERRIVQYMRNEVRHPPAWEYLTMRARVGKEIEDWAARNDAEAAELRARLVEWPTA